MNKLSPKLVRIILNNKLLVFIALFLLSILVCNFLVVGIANLLFVYFLSFVNLFSVKGKDMRLSIYFTFSFSFTLPSFFQLDVTCFQKAVQIKPGQLHTWELAVTNIASVSSIIEKASFTGLTFIRHKCTLSCLETRIMVN